MISQSSKPKAYTPITAELITVITFPKIGIKPTKTQITNKIAG